MRPGIVSAGCRVGRSAIIPKEIDVATPNEFNAHGRRFRPAAASGWQVACAILLIIAGFLAMLMPGVAAVTTALLFAWLLIIGGASELAYAVQTRQQKGFGWKLASGILTLILGIAILVLPLAGVASLALLVGGFLFAGGVARTLLALQLKPARGWGWVLVDGLLSLVIAGLIAIGWPENSIAFIGLLTGFWLVWAGVWRILLCPTSPA
jgi:uncharacterized membrane protein HdeD (DUF308 family)